MDYRNLGASGLRVSVVGLGCNNFGGRIDLEAARAVIDRALDLGITFFDTADIYGERGGSETALGTILGKRRQEVVLATKFGGAMDDAGNAKGASRRYIRQAVEASLKRLKTDWIDLYQLHFPDPLTPIEETLRALDELVREGKIRYFGSSNLAAWQVVEAEWTARSLGINRFVSVQDEYSLVVRDVEKEVVPVIEAYRLGFIPYFPLASGLLTGKYRGGGAPAADTRFALWQGLAKRYLTEQNLQWAERLDDFAQSRGHTMLELAFSWLASHPFVSSVIAGATKPEQVERNAAAAAWLLSPEERAEIDRLSPAP